MRTLSTLSDINSDYAIALDDCGIISVSGEQTDDYLQGQLTVDIKQLPADNARRSAHCDFKGKAWSLSLLARYENTVLISTAKSALAQSLAQLNKYGVFSKVDIEDASDRFYQLALSGKKAEQWITTSFGSLPSETLGVLTSPLGLVIRHDYPDNLYLVVLNPGGKAELDQWMDAESVSLYSDDVYNAIAIKHGLPQVSGDNVNQFVPQMMNYQHLNGIDFKKGCYMGQEVIARTRYLGKNKRAAYSFCVPSATAVNEGDTVEKQVQNNWRRGGTIIRSASLKEETWFMAVLPNDTTPESRFRLANAQEIEVTPLPLPYTIESQTSA